MKDPDLRHIMNFLENGTLPTEEKKARKLILVRTAVCTNKRSATLYEQRQDTETHSTRGGLTSAVSRSSRWYVWWSLGGS